MTPNALSYQSIGYDGLAHRSYSIFEAVILQADSRSYHEDETSCSQLHLRQTVPYSIFVFDRGRRDTDLKSWQQSRMSQEKLGLAP